MNRYFIAAGGYAFSERHEALKLTGAPPSYVGYDDGGQLLNAFGSVARKGEPWTQTRRRAVLLLDEIEKAHPSVYDLFLSAFDYGIVTGGRGERLDLRECVIVMTSNVGVREATEAAARRGIGFGADARDAAADAAAARDRALRARFAPEFLNRLDAVVAFEELGADDLARILDLRLAAYDASLRAAGLGVAAGPRLRARMVASALASGMGGRDLVLRQFGAEIEDRVTRALVDGLYHRGAVLEIEDDEDGATRVRRRLPGARAAAA